MAFHTIINTCKLLNVNPKAFLLDSALRSCRHQKLLTPFEYRKQLELRYEVIRKEMGMAELECHEVFRDVMSRLDLVVGQLCLAITRSQADQQTPRYREHSYREGIFGTQVIISALSAI